MKNDDQIKGLAWFFLVYALCRMALTMPIMADQPLRAFAVFFGSMCIAWLAYTNFKHTIELALLATSLATVAGFVLIRFGYFASLEILLSLTIVGGISALISLFYFIQSFVRPEKAGLFWPIIFRFTFVTIFLIIIDYTL